MNTILIILHVTRTANLLPNPGTLRYHMMHLFFLFHQRKQAHTKPRRVRRSPMRILRYAGKPGDDPWDPQCTCARIASRRLTHTTVHYLPRHRPPLTFTATPNGPRPRSHVRIEHFPPTQRPHCAPVSQQVHHLLPPGQIRTLQRCLPAQPNLGIDIGPCVQHHPHNLLVTRFRRRMQRHRSAAGAF